MGPTTIIAKRSPYRYEVELNGTKHHYHANRLRKFRVRVESILFDSRAFEFVDSQEFLCVDLSVNGINSCAVVYQDDNDWSC